MHTIEVLFVFHSQENTRLLSRDALCKAAWQILGRRPVKGLRAGKRAGQYGIHKRAVSAIAPVAPDRITDCAFLSLGVSVIQR